MRSNLKFRILSLLATLLLAGETTLATVTLPRMFSDGMVLQRQQPIAVWGWATPGQAVKVSLEPVGKGRKYSVTAQADEQGCWRASLPPMAAAGPLTLRADSLTIRDVWVGDVWLLSGQSNIDIDVERVHPQYPEEIDRDSSSQIRLFKIENQAVLEGPVRDVHSRGWQTLSKRNAWKFSALGYFLGKLMAQETGVAQGVIQSSWGGTPIESWMPRDSVALLSPQMAMEARYYADAQLRTKVNEANAQASQRWNRLLDEADPGMTGHWMNPDMDDSGWQQVDQYHLSTPYPFNGTYWMRQHIQVDANHAGKPALLLLGTLVDADFTYVNGQQVGHTAYQYPPRRYEVPAGLLHEGDNVIAVRFVNRGMAPQFISEKPYRLEWSDGSEQSLSTEWLAHNGQQMPRLPQMQSAFHNMAGAAFNGMLVPLAPYTLAGVVWYQGESNTGQPVIYEQQLHTLMNTWRHCFASQQLPFVIVQLANFMRPSAQPQNSNWARLRESQRRAALTDPRAELAVAIDLGEANDIHPLRKRELAQRVALAFQRLVFGKKCDLSPQPLTAWRNQDGSTTVTFDQPVTATRGFETADADGKFRTAEAQVHGTQVRLTPGGQQVRYAWKDNPTEADCKASRTGLPATPFQMEEQPLSKK